MVPHWMGETSSSTTFSPQDPLPPNKAPTNTPSTNAKGDSQLIFLYIWLKCSSQYEPNRALNDVGFRSVGRARRSLVGDGSSVVSVLMEIYDIAAGEEVDYIAEAFSGLARRRRTVWPELAHPARGR